jgi:hypothetical protein
MEKVSTKQTLMETAPQANGRGCGEGPANAQAA